MKQLSQPRLGKRLKCDRKKLGYTLAVASKKAKLWPGNLQRIENGADVQISTLARILKAYGIIKL